MASCLFYVVCLLSVVLAQSCEVFTGMTCTCYEPVEIRCTMSKIVPLAFVSPAIAATRKFHSIDLTFDSSENLQFDSNAFALLNQLLPSSTRNSLSMIFRFQNMQSFHAKASAFASLFNGITSPHKRLMIELHPVKVKSITFDANTFNKLQVNELSIYADSLSSSFEAIFANTNITHLNIEGAIITHDPILARDFSGRIHSLKITRMTDTVNSEEFPPFPVQSYTIEAHKMRVLDALSFVNYTQLSGLNIIQPDVFITPKILTGLERLHSLKSVSIDADRIADGALKHVKHIHTLILGAHLKILDTESLNSLKTLQQLDVRYVQFSTLQDNTSCPLADFINRRRMTGLTVYLPEENADCDCILVFLNNMIDDGSQLLKCQSTSNDRCLFSSCPIVSEYFTRKQKEDVEQQQQQEQQPAQQPEEDPFPVIPPAESSSPNPPFVPPSVDFNDDDAPYYRDDNALPPFDQASSPTIKPVEPLAYDDNDEVEGAKFTDRTIPPIGPTRPNPFLKDPEAFENDFSTPMMRRVHGEPKKYRTNNYRVVPWIPFAIIASCLFLFLIIAMISYIIYHKRRTTSFKLVPQAAPIV